MLEGLKTILGDKYSEEIDKKISDEIGKGFVARSDFNTVNKAKQDLETAVKDRDTQLENLKNTTGDVTALNTKIVELQTANATQAKEHADALKQLKIDNAVDTALINAKAKNPKAVKALLELEKAELAEDGTVKGLSDQIDKLVKAADSSFLFDTGSKSATFKGVKPAEGGDKTPPSGGSKAPKDMTYEELCALLAENPDAKLE